MNIAIAHSQIPTAPADLQRTDDAFSFDFDGERINGLLIDDGGWLDASDVATALGYRKATDFTRTLDEDEKGTHSVRTPGGIQAKLHVSEAGLYKGILQRRATKALPAATMARIQRFQRRVFHEVLPEIQRTGSYAPVAVRADFDPVLTPMLEALKDPSMMVALVAHHASARLAEEQAHALTRISRDEHAHGRQVVTAALADLHVRVDADRPKVLAHERLAMAAGDRSLSDAAVEIGVDRIRIVDHLLSLGFLVRGADRRVRCSRNGRLSGLVRPSVEPVEGDDGREILRGEVRVTATGFAALAEHFCRGAQATSQDIIPGL